MKEHRLTNRTNIYDNKKVPNDYEVLHFWHGVVAAKANCTMNWRGLNPINCKSSLLGILFAVSERNIFCNLSSIAILD